MLQTFLLLGVTIFTNVIAQLLLKKGMILVGKIEFSSLNLLKLIFQIFQNAYLFFGLISFGVSLLLWLFVISKLQLNIAYPIVASLNFTLLVLASWFLFKEELSFFQILGIVAVISGIFLLVKS